MLRGAVAILIGAAVLSWSGLPRDSSIREQMLPVHMGNTEGRVLFVSRFEVTAESWAQCFRDKVCSHMPSTASRNAAKPMPVTGVNWFDVNEYLIWVNKRSGGGLRLPTLDEWREINHSAMKPKPVPLFTDPRLAWAASYGQEESPGGPVRPVGSFSKTPEGISDLDGNVWEWTATCYKTGFGGKDVDMCPAFFVMGAHEAVISVFERNPAAGGCATGTPPTYLGLRLVADRER